MGREGGKGPRKEAPSSPLRFDRAGPEEKTRPARTWKKASARMRAEEPEAVSGGGQPFSQPEAASDNNQPSPQPEAQAVPEEAPTTQEEPQPAEGGETAPPPGASGRNFPKGKLRQHSQREAVLGEAAPTRPFRPESGQARPADKLRHDGDGAGGHEAAPEPEPLRKSRLRMEQRRGKADAAREKLARQKPYKPPGPVRHVAGFAGRGVHGFVHGKIYEAEHENVGTEGAHRAELVGEAVGRKAVRFTQNRVRTHPARAVRRAERRYTRAAADYHFRQVAQVHPELTKNALTRLWRKRQQRRRYQKQAREAAKQGARAAKKTAVTAEKAGRAIAGFVRRHPLGVLLALLCLLLVVGLQSCVSSLSVLGNGMTGSVAATTYPADDPDLLGAEAAYTAREAELQDYLDSYTAAHSYDEYHFDLDEITHDPYVLLSILSALHEEGWTLADVEGDLQALFDRQYILTARVVVETRQDSEGNSYSWSICYVTLKNEDLSHLPVYLMGQGQLSRYALYMAALGNRPDLFPHSDYVGKYTQPVERYEVPAEYMGDEAFAALLTEAEKYVGYPYVWGGSSPATSFDCSGYLSWVLNQCGWSVGRLGAQGLYNYCTPTGEPRPGDLVFFTGTYDTPGVSHCGLYLGDGMMLHCGDPIGYANLNTSYWRSHFYAYGRLP